MLRYLCYNIFIIIIPPSAFLTQLIFQEELAEREKEGEMKRRWKKRRMRSNSFQSVMCISLIWEVVKIGFPRDSTSLHLEQIPWVSIFSHFLMELGVQLDCVQNKIQSSTLSAKLFLRESFISSTIVSQHIQTVSLKPRSYWWFSTLLPSHAQFKASSLYSVHEEYSESLHWFFPFCYSHLSPCSCKYLFTGLPVSSPASCYYKYFLLSSVRMIF